MCRHFTEGWGVGGGGAVTGGNGMGRKREVNVMA